MEIITIFSLLLLSSLLLSSITLFSGPSQLKKSTKNLTTSPPKLPGAWPLIGHLHRLGGQAPTARILGAMADDHGPIFSLQLGSRPAIVVSHRELIKDCFTKNDQIFASRPRMSILNHIVYQGAVFALAPHGPFWRDIRKIVTLHLFATNRLEKLRHIRVSEVGRSVVDLYSMVKEKGDSGQVVDLSRWFEDLTFSVAIRMMVGENKNGQEERDLRGAIKKVLDLSGLVVVSDAIPWLEWMDIGGHLKAIRTTTEDIDRVLDTWLGEHVVARKDRNYINEDLMDVMLSVLDENYSMDGHNRDTIIKATLLILLMAGSESTAEALIWAVSLLLNNPRTLKVAQEELDNHVGRDRPVEEADIKKLKYLQAIVKETLRLYPPGPLSGPRESTDDGYIGKYYVSKGTRLVVNLWKLHRDPKVWSNPDEFRPERFLEEHENVGFMGQTFEYLPFGSGRRMCPGMNFASLIVHYGLARLIQGFSLSTPMDMPVDMTEGKGLALPKVKPLIAILFPRLERELYESI